MSTHTHTHTHYDKLQTLSTVRTTVKSQLPISLSTNFLARPSIKRDIFGNPRELLKKSIHAASGRTRFLYIAFFDAVI